MYLTPVKLAKCMKSFQIHVGNVKDKKQHFTISGGCILKQKVLDIDSPAIAIDI